MRAFAFSALFAAMVAFATFVQAAPTTTIP
jgi:hypothetical protein